MVGSCLTINLEALCENWRLLDAAARGAETAAVVKADAYGLGMEPVACALAKAGVKSFFVAQGQEGAMLREYLGDVRIFVFNGALAGEETLFQDCQLIPVLNSLEDCQRWGQFASQSGYKAAALHVDTGMNRLGLSGADFHRLCNDATLFEALDIQLMMSHLVAGDDQSSSLNLKQLTNFRALMGMRTDALSHIPLSLANSAGVLLGWDYHFDVTRVGIGLYGGKPTSHRENPMKPVVKLEAPILQSRQIKQGETVSYGATWKAVKDSKLVTIAVGYADGLLRGASPGGMVAINGQKAPIVGRVTMDLIVADVTDIEADTIKPGQMVEVIGDTILVDELAEAVGTISYEILTSLGARYERRYVGA